VVICVVVLLLRVVSDLKGEVTKSRKEAEAFVKPALLTRLIELNNIRLLKRVRDAFRISVKRNAMHEFDRDLHHQIEQISAGMAPSSGTDEEDVLHQPNDFYEPNY